MVTIIIKGLLGMLYQIVRKYLFGYAKRGGAMPGPGSGLRTIFLVSESLNP